MKTSGYHSHFQDKQLGLPLELFENMDKKTMKALVMHKMKTKLELDRLKYIRRKVQTPLKYQSINSQLPASPEFKREHLPGYSFMNDRQVFS
jgi:hypothetical protein